MSNITKKTEAAMKTLSELSRDAGQAEQLHVMYAANRAWRELDKANRRRSQSPQESAK